jgi:hypothetical protein
MKNSSFLSLAFAAVVLFSSCKKDDNNGGGGSTEPTIVAKWEWVSRVDSIIVLNSTYIQNLPRTFPYRTYNVGGAFFDFKSDLTFDFTYPADPSYDGTGTYVYDKSNNLLSLLYEGESEADDYNVKSLTSSALKLNYESNSFIDTADVIDSAQGYPWQPMYGSFDSINTLKISYTLNMFKN